MLRRYPSLGTILLLISLMFLLLPLCGIYFLRIYESALIRQTESELISQAAFVAALYKQEVLAALKEGGRNPAFYGVPVSNPQRSHALVPVIAQLDLAKDTIHPPRPQPRYTRDQLDPAASSAGVRILPVLVDAQRITLSGIKVLDPQGIVVAGQEERLSFAHTEEFLRSRTGQSVSLIRDRRMPKQTAPMDSLSRNATINVYVALPVMLEERLIGVVWVNRTPTDIMQSLYRKRFELAWTGLFLLAVTLLITAFTSYTVTQPIRALVEKTRLIAQGKPEGMAPLEDPMTREVAELSESIAHMARTIQHRTEYIRNFTAHVSHEFKTPLTAIRGSVELLQDNLSETSNPMSAEQHKRFLTHIAEDTMRLDRLVGRLLELVQADMSESFGRNSLLCPLLENIVQRTSAEGFTVKIENPPQSELLVPITPESLEAVLINLVENSRQAGASRVILSVEVGGEAVLLLVQDNGSGISEGNRREIFTPFFTTRRGSGGTGLGLSITRALLQRQGGDIVLEPAQEGISGAVFRITLPLA